jgi:hypothetical protein
MTGAFGSWNTQGGNPPNGIPGFLHAVSGAGPITVESGQSVHVTAFASINNPEKLSGPLYFVIFYAPAYTVGSPIPVGEEQEEDFSGDIPTFQIGSTALIQNLPPGSYIVGLAARLPLGGLDNMLAAIAGACAALVF